MRYRRIDVVTLLHPVVVRLRGFDAGGQARTAGKRRPLPLRIGDLLGTVPALAYDGQRISTNHRIGAFWTRTIQTHHCFLRIQDSGPQVEDAERWANETLQMAARRITLPAVVRDPAGFSRASADGRMGYLLYRSAFARRLICPLIGRLVFGVASTEEDDEIVALPSMLDRIDGWITDGVIGGAELNVADFMIAPSLALILYRPDALALFQGRPSLELVDRLLPEPAHAGADSLR